MTVEADGPATAGRGRSRPSDHPTPQLHGGGGDEHELLGRATTAAGLGHRHGIGTELTLQPGDGPDSSFVGFGLPTPEPQLSTLRGDDLVGDQRDPCDTGARPGRRGTVEPTVELPSHPVGDRRRRQRPLMTPHPQVGLAMVGLGLDRDPHTRRTLAGQAPMEIVGERPGHERHPIDPVSRGVDDRGHRPVGRGQPRIGRLLVESGREAMRTQTFTTEPGDDVGGGERGERGERVQAEAMQHIGQLRLFEHRHGHGGQEGRAVPRRDATRGRGRPGGQACRERPVGDADPARRP
ncbi:MAG: hypothetical protein R2695_01650, partial [Acidimicrobiales bacterium]